jgi:hypothetical protein
LLVCLLLLSVCGFCCCFFFCIIYSNIPSNFGTFRIFFLDMLR